MNTWICVYIIFVCLSMIHALKISSHRKHYLKYPDSLILLSAFLWGLTFPVAYPVVYLMFLRYMRKRGATK